MNYTTSFIPPAKPAKQEHTPELGASSKSKECSTPFGNVLDRAVKTPSKLKTDFLTVERGQENRTARSMETCSDAKSSDPTRDTGSKIKDEEKKKENDSPTPVVCIGIPTPIVPLPVEIAIVLANKITGDSSVSVASDSATSDNGTPNNEVKPAQGGPAVDFTKPVAGGITTTIKSSSEPESTAGSSTPRNLVSDLAPITPEVSAKNLPTVERPVTVLELKTEEALKSLPMLANELPPEKFQPLDAQSQLTNATRPTIAEARPMIPVSNAREAGRGVSPEVTPMESVAEIVQPAAVVQASEASNATPIETRRAVRAARRAQDVVAENPRGTDVAKMDMTMNKALKQEAIAGLTGQILPSAPSMKVSTGKNLPSEPERGHSSEIVSLDALNVAARTAGGPTRSDSSEVKDVRNAEGASASGRLGEVISREVRMFKRGADDLVEVVLTPDAKTQISLKLQWREGQVEVQARCDTGNYQSLNAHWSELQAALATHGVRLSHLAERVHTGFTEFFNNSGFSQQRGNDQHSAPQQHASDVTLPSVMQPVKGNSTKPTIRSSRRLESWA